MFVLNYISNRITISAVHISILIIDLTWKSHSHSVQTLGVSCIKYTNTSPMFYIFIFNALTCDVCKNSLEKYTMLYLYYEQWAIPWYSELRLGNVQIPVVNKIFIFDRIK